jgi:4-hydroxythreonine-4-phosphate dehydrogenase
VTLASAPRPLAVSVGDPAGIGPLVAAAASIQCVDGDRIALFGDAEQLEALLRERARGRAPGVRRLDASSIGDLSTGEVGCVHVTSWDRAAQRLHAPSAQGGREQLRVLDAAMAAVRGGLARALVTGPTSKEAITRAGVPFKGQTEHLARAAGLADDAVTMMFLGPRLRVALVTTHLAVGEVPGALSILRVARAVTHLAEALLRMAPVTTEPLRIVVTGLNPHAGEGGLFGDEEARIIVPGMARARAAEPFADGRVCLEGPVPAEAAFREASAERWDGVVTMMHDQATIASKLLDWGQAVNVTWGLPFVRTSVDHGVAYDAAARGQAHEGGMVAAIRMAQALTGGARSEGR